MAGRGRGLFDIEVIAIHFDVPGHAIPLDTFVRTSEQTEAAIRSLSSVLSQEFRFEVVVLPPADGTFLARLGVVVVAGAAALWAGIESDVGKGFVKGLTGQEPAHWAEEMGKLARAGVESLAPAHDELLPTRDDLAALAVSELAKSLLSRDNVDLARAGIAPRQFRDMFEAKNEFYRACVDAPQIAAVGFTAEPDFPIQRSDFVRLHAALPPKEDEDAQHPWSVEITTVRVSSPNWDRNDRGRRWKARDPQGRDRLFFIEDEGFWKHVTADAIHTHVIDVMKVQWAFQGSSDQRKNLRVLRVIEFNGQPMSSVLSDDELEVAVGRLSTVDDAQRRNLFD